ncbi:MAG: lysophospholipid acyltransferase family protein [Gammaproteobacteria bacterium]|nr:lysophospholipid acyltransferase family protein [Gammaproteobacteria bacterium]
MLQRFANSLNHIITNTFFRRIEVAGRENVPADGPVIFAGNHPNALMDGWLLTAKCGRWPVRFLANAKLWKYRLLVPLLNASGAIPVYRQEEHDGKVDNQKAFDKLYEVIESGQCIGIFPEGVSHVESQLMRLKTGTARIALSVADRKKANPPIIPCGLNYIHRHRFRSQVLIEFGEPIRVDEGWLERFRKDEQGTVLELTDKLAEGLKRVTVNAPDWRTLHFIQAARRLYKPSSAELTPLQYTRLNRRFVNQYIEDRDQPELQELTDDVENYQARLEMLGLKDYQLRYPVSLGYAFRKILLRTLTMLALLPLAIPGALLHLPIGWIAATIGDRFSYETDDVATLKVFSTLLLLPVLYIAIAIVIGNAFGGWVGLLTLIALPFSFLLSVRLLEAEVGLFNSLLSFIRLTRLRREVDDLREIRADLVTRVRDRVERNIDPDMQRVFSNKDFAQQRTDS